MKFPLLFNLIAGHAVADYGLQTGYIAAEKQRNPVVLLAHCLIHGFLVTQILKQSGVSNASAYGAAETMAHIGIDYAKSRYGVSEMVDQGLHVVCKMVIAAYAKK